MREKVDNRLVQAELELGAPEKEAGSDADCAILAERDMAVLDGSSRLLYIDKVVSVSAFGQGQGLTYIIEKISPSRLVVLEEVSDGGP